MDRWTGKLAVVTGASAGIGLSIAKALVQNGMIVIGLARRLEKMKEELKFISGPGVFYAKVCDVKNEKEITEVFDWIEGNFQSVHILINNAGCCINSTIESMKTEDMRHVIDVNLVGYLLCTQKAMKIMKKNNHDAHIININAVTGHKVPMLDKPWNVYPSTKYAITALCESLIQELAGGRIRVTSISPGVVETEADLSQKAKSEFVEDEAKLKPEDVANSVIHVISAPQHVQITELIIKPLGQLY